MMKVLSLVLCSFSLGSCVTFINNPPDITVVQSQGTIATAPPQCDRFIMPPLPNLPVIPDLSDDVIKSRHLTEDALLHIISEHRAHSRKVKQVIDEAYREYVASCK